jgi:DNA modification methylase
MPESVTDRPTKAHETIFLLAKSERYFYDAEAIKEKSTQNGRPHPAGKKISPSRNDTDLAGRTIGDGITRNRRTVWTVATSPYGGAHFATFPPSLVEPMVLAGSQPGDTVLDPFAGTATVGRVCVKHQRHFVGLELNPAYIELALDRTANVQMSLLSPADF